MLNAIVVSILFAHNWLLSQYHLAMEIDKHSIERDPINIRILTMLKLNAHLLAIAFSYSQQRNILSFSLLYLSAGIFQLKCEFIENHLLVRNSSQFRFLFLFSVLFRFQYLNILNLDSHRKLHYAYTLLALSIVTISFFPILFSFFLFWLFLAWQIELQTQKFTGFYWNTGKCFVFVDRFLVMNE